MKSIHLTHVALLGLAVMSATACAGPPRRVNLDDLRAAGPRDEFEIHATGGSRTWHGVEVHGDSLSGVVLHQPPGCDSCRVAVPLAAVDSVRATSVEQNWIMVSLVPVAALLVLGLGMSLGGSD